MHTRSKTRLTREGWYYLFVVTFVLAGGLLREINLLLVFGGMLLGTLLTSWWMARRSLKRLDIERLVPAAIGAGDQAIIGLTLTNRARRGSARMIIVEDSLQRVLPTAFAEPIAADVLFSEVHPGESRRLTYRGRLPRGRYQFGSLRIVTRFPLGLLVHTVTLQRPQELIVRPRLGWLGGRGSAARQETWLGSRRAQHRHGTLEADFYGLRDWRSGDSRRWIHWRTSARRGALMVRQFEQPRQEDVLVLVELWQPELPDLRQQENVELALSYAATLLADACRGGTSRALLAVAARETVVKPGVASRAYLDDVLETLATAQASDKPSLVSIAQQAAPLMKAGGQVVVISTRAVELPPELRSAVPAARLSLVNVDSPQFSERFVVPPVQETNQERAATKSPLPSACGERSRTGEGQGEGRHASQISLTQPS